MNKYFRAISANLFYFIINTLFFLVITPVSIRVMGPEFFGLWSILNALVILSNIGTLGISSIVNKFASEAHADINSIRAYNSDVILAGLSIVMLMAGIAALSLALARNFIARHLDITPVLQAQFGTALLFVAAGIFPQFLSRVPQGFLLSQLKNGLVRKLETFFSISLWLGALAISIYKKDLVLIALWCLVISTATFLVYFHILRQSANIALRVNPTMIRKMMGYSKYMFIESIAIALFQQVDRVIVGLALGPALAGVYSVGTSMGSRMSLVVGQVTEVMIPYASLKDSLDDHTRLLAVFRRLSRYVSLMIALLSGLLALWMPEILRAWISPDYAARYAGPFAILVVAYGLLSLCRPAHQALTGMGRVRVTSLVYLFSTTAMLIALFFLSRRFGLFGATSANFMMTILLTYNLYCYHLLAGHVPWRQVFDDMKWGIFVPLTMLVAALLSPLIWIKVLLSFGLGTIMAIAILRDDWVRPWLFQQAKHFIRP